MCFFIIAAGLGMSRVEPENLLSDLVEPDLVTREEGHPGYNENLGISASGG